MISFTLQDAADNTLRSVFYSYATDGTGAKTWIQSDNLTGALTSKKEHNFDEEHLIKDSSGKTLTGTKLICATVGSGTAAVERVVQRFQYDGYFTGWHRADYAYWTDNLNQRVNGKLKLRKEPGGNWIYQTWDATGRNELQATALDGSSAPDELWGAEELQFSPSGSCTAWEYALNASELTITSYSGTTTAPMGLLDRTVRDHQ
ncbi:MAG: hypothetical protein PHO37_17610 [Kiritimatiellae bacterium]|nr:hypothetical protein [Kiritimatiellia bacterium]